MMPKCFTDAALGYQAVAKGERLLLSLHRRLESSMSHMSEKKKPERSHSTRSTLLRVIHVRLRATVATYSFREPNHVTLSQLRTTSC
jgi:hypothetical protein